MCACIIHKFYLNDSFFLNKQRNAQRIREGGSPPQNNNHRHHHPSAGKTSRRRSRKRNKGTQKKGKRENWNEDSGIHHQHPGRLQRVVYIVACVRKIIDCWDGDGALLLHQQTKKRKKPEGDTYTINFKEILIRHRRRRQQHPFVCKESVCTQKRNDDKVFFLSFCCG